MSNRSRITMRANGPLECFVNAIFPRADISMRETESSTTLSMGKGNMRSARRGTPPPQAL